MKQLIIIVMTVLLGCATHSVREQEVMQRKQEPLIVSCDKEDADFETIIEIEIPDEFKNTWIFYYRNVENLSDIKNDESDGSLFNNRNSEGGGFKKAYVSISSRIVKNSIEVRMEYSKPKEAIPEYLESMNVKDTEVEEEIHVKKEFSVPMNDLPIVVHEADLKIKIDTNYYD